jgi:hypothetical protein
MKGNSDKPPVGLKPKKIHDEQRMHEVQGALIRYISRGMPIPSEWIVEYEALILLTVSSDKSKPDIWKTN